MKITIRSDQMQAKHFIYQCFDKSEFVLTVHGGIHCLTHRISIACKKVPTHWQHPCTLFCWSGAHMYVTGQKDVNVNNSVISLHPSSFESSHCKFPLILSHQAEVSLCRMEDTLAITWIVSIIPGDGPLCMMCGPVRSDQSEGHKFLPIVNPSWL